MFFPRKEFDEFDLRPIGQAIDYKTKTE